VGFGWTGGVVIRFDRSLAHSEQLIKKPPTADRGLPSAVTTVA